jgi:quercetin dioxygenase-like cupin family protein
MGPLEYIVFKATGSTTGGAFELLELTVQPGGGPPDHLHRQHDETYYLIDGTLRFRLASDLITGVSGSTIFVPRETEHAFFNGSAAPARMLVVVTPSGLQDFFERLGPLSFGPPDEGAIADISAEYGCEDVPPLT